jgi:hypothetical protein
LTATIANNPGGSNIAWTISPATGCGTINTTTALTNSYTPPATLTSGCTATVTAAANPDPSKSASVTFTVGTPPSLTISSGGQSSVGEAAQVSVTATTSDPLGVAWTISPSTCGTLSGTTLTSATYVAPASIASSCTAVITGTAKSDSADSSAVSITVNPITVAVTPTTAISIPATDNNQTSTMALTATLTNDAANGNVNWTLDTTNCGSISPTTSASGANVTFTAVNAKTNNLAAACVANVTATSATDSTKTATKQITVNPPAVTLGTSGSLALAAGASGQTLTATLTSLAPSATPSLTWSISPASGCGTLTPASSSTSPATGTYTPPTTLSSACTATVSVKYNQNLYYAASVVYSVSATPPVTVTVSANPTGAVGEAAQVAISSTTSDSQGVNWTISPITGCGTLSAATLTSVSYAAQSPLAASCTATVTGTSKSNSAISNSVSITVNPITVSVSALSNSIYAGNSTSLTAAVTNDGASAGVNWSISSPSNGSCGSVATSGATSATYTAPASVSASCTATIVATSVTDPGQSNSTQITVVQPLTIAPQLSGIASGETGQTYGQTFTAANGTGPYTWTISGSLPPGVEVSTTNTNQIIGVPTAAGSYTVSVQTYDAGTLQTANASYTIHIGNGTGYSNTGMLYGSYTCYYQGHKNDGSAEAMVWTMKANCSTASDGSCSTGGYIKSGVLDFNNTSGSTTLLAPATIVASSVCTSTNCYTVGSDMRGIVRFAYTANSVTTNNTFAVAIGNYQQVSSQGNPDTTLATELRLTRIDDVGDGGSYIASGRYGAGQCFRDEQGIISSTDAAGSIGGVPTYNWVFGLSGANGANQPEVAGGTLTICGGTGTSCGGTATTGVVTNGLVDLVSGKTASSGGAFTGSFITDSNTNNLNRYRFALSGLPATNWALYLATANRAFMMSLDPHATSDLLVGQLRNQQQSSYSASNLSGSFVAYESAATVPITSGTQGYFTNLVQGSGDGAGSVTIQASTMNQNGQIGTSSNGTSALTVNSNGRFAYGGDWLYLYDNNQAILLDAATNSSSQNAGLGWLEAQSSTTPLATATECSAPLPSPPSGTCSEASVTFPYFTGSLPSFDATMSSESGILTLDGSGDIGFTQDFVGRGTASLDNIFSGLVTDWTAMGWPNTTYGTFQVDNGGNTQMYCAVVSAGDSPILGFPNGRAICANAPGESIGVSSAGRPSITILQQ